MKDLDFDELDRAVNSLMSKTASTEPQTPTANADTVVEIDSSQAAAPVAPAGDGQAVAATPAEAPSQNQVPTGQKEATTQPIVGPRKSGRFMDVMHQSSDMRSATRTLDPPSAKPARFGGANLQPTGADVTPEVATVTGTGVSGESASQGQVGAMPDPIDFAMQSNEGSAEEGGQDDQIESRPYSPFVPDAVVEKRPLGGASTEVSTPEEGQSEASRVLEPDVESQLPASPGEQLPAELQSDLIAIESSDPTTSQDSDQVEAEVGGTTVESSAESAPAAATARPQIESIPNQYKAKPRTTEADAEADIFNTDSFSKPLSHPAKKKSGWLTVLLIFLLVVLGAGLGALVYLFVL